jgi:hypothetical protein
VSDDVGQRLSGNPVRGDLDRGWQCRQRLGRPNDHLDWAVSTALLSQCPDQPELVESGWPEPIRELAYALDGLPQLIGELDRQRFGPFWSVLGGKGDAVGFEGCAGEERA